MKWETVKDTVARGVFTEIQQCWGPVTLPLMLLDLVTSGFAVIRDIQKRENNTAHGAAIATEYANKAWEVIMKWDLRAVGRLRELFPRYFPPSLRKGELVAYMADNENCDWMVECR